jgi:hypothetical protein
MLDHNPLAASVRGERYEASVPDTLDLAHRMGLAVNALTNVWYPSERYALAFNVDFSRRPPLLSINHLTDAYLNIPAKFIEALVVCRLASGSRQNIEVDRGVLDAQLSFIGDDGLTYTPTDTLERFTKPRPFSEVWGEGRLLLALSMLAQVDDDPRWAEAAKRKVDRFLELSRRKDGFRFLWKAGYSPGDNPPADADEPSKPVKGVSLADHDPFFSIIYSTGALGHGAGLLYRITGYEPALELSEGLARWALARVFTREDGRWDFYHFHHSLYSLMAVCEYGAASGDRAALERVDACYRWAREMGDPLIGYFPEYMPGSDNYLNRRGNTTEACEVADMLYLALCLTREGMGDYWDDVDRWIRNVHAESQMLDAGFVDAIPEDYLLSGPNHRVYLDSRDVAARSIGSFWGWMSANDGIHLDRTAQAPKLRKSSIMHCCTANGARALYLVWDAMLRQEGDETTVELLLNRASPWLDVDSYLPVEGRVVLHVKNTRSVRVRMPDWSNPGQVRATVGDNHADTQVQGRYVRVGGLSPGDKVTLTFPVPEHTEHRVIGESAYKLTLRGSNVVSIDPEGSIYPLYARQPTGAAVAKERFVPEIQGLVW